MLTIDNNYKYLLGVSGGSDSMALLDMFAKLEYPPRFEVVTINHNLREQAADNCRLVQRYCHSRNIVCHIENVDVLSYCATNKVSVETGARLLRRQVFERYQCDYVALAHNSDDSVESILMNMARGSGTNGMTGIAVLSGKIIRPLLMYTKQQLTQYCVDNGVEYCIDETNVDIKYARNYVRHEIIPRLEHINKEAKNNVLDLAQLIRQDNEFIDSCIDYASIAIESDTASIPLELLRCGKSVAYRVIRYALVRLMGSATDIFACHYEDIIALTTKPGGKRLSLPFDISVYNDYNKISIVVGEQPLPTVEELPFAVGQVQTALGTVNITALSPQDDNIACLQFDISAIGSDAVIRTIRAKDTIAKFGGGSKLVSRYLSDKKIPNRERRRLLVVAQGSEVLIICGVEIARNVAVKDNATAHYIFVT